MARGPVAAQMYEFSYTENPPNCVGRIRELFICLVIASLLLALLLNISRSLLLLCINCLVSTEHTYGIFGARLCYQAPESIELFIEDKASSPWYDLDRPPLLSASCLSSESSFVSPVELTVGRGLAWSQIIRPQKTLACYKSFNTFWDRSSMHNLRILLKEVTSEEFTKTLYKT